MGILGLALKELNQALFQWLLAHFFPFVAFQLPSANSCLLQCDGHINIPITSSELIRMCAKYSQVLSLHSTLHFPPLLHEFPKERTSSFYLHCHVKSIAVVCICMHAYLNLHGVQRDKLWVACCTQHAPPHV